MPIKRLFLLLAILPLFSFTPPNLSGKWLGKFAEGFDVQLDLTAEGSKLSGIMNTFMGQRTILDGKIKGETFSFSVKNDDGRLVYTGKVAGDDMTLQVVWNGRELNANLKRLAPNEAFPVIWRPEMTEYYEPVPPVVNPGPYAGMVTAPADAVVLFDGKDLSAWKSKDGDAKWEVSNGAFTVKKGTGDIETKQAFGDYQLHIEWMIPADIAGEGQSRGNSGIFMQGIYEVQVLDSYDNKTYVNGQAGSIYKQVAPLVNAMRKPGEWNVYDIFYTAPRFRDNGTILYPAKITIIHNGILIQNNFEIRGNTPYIGFPKYTAHGKGPIKLQDHGDPSKPISFRNIWLREL